MRRCGSAVLVQRISWERFEARGALTWFSQPYTLPYTPGPSRIASRIMAGLLTAHQTLKGHAGCVAIASRIMAGLLIRELQLRRLAERILIVGPSNLAFQWQRELQEKFDDTFLVMKGDNLRAQFGVNQWMRQRKVVTSLDLAKRDDIPPGLRQAHLRPCCR